MTSDPRPEGPKLLAPRWHTALLVGLLLAVAVSGTLLTARNPTALAAPEFGSRITSVCLPMILVAWGVEVAFGRGLGPG